MVGLAFLELPDFSPEVPNYSVQRALEISGKIQVGVQAVPTTMDPSPNISSL